MYVYYETHRFGSAFYTHRITVHENANGRLCEKIQAKYGRKAVSWNLKRGRIYVRETLRIARVHRNKPRTARIKTFGEWHFATSKNYGLSIYSEIVPELGERRLERYNFLDEDVARRVPSKRTGISRTVHGIF